MKRKPEETQRRVSTTRVASAARVMLVAASLCAVAAVASGFDDFRRPDPLLLMACGDETIGTLPILQGAQTIELRRDLPITVPSLCFEGELNEILNSIVIANGKTIAKVEHVVGNTTRVRVIFQGSIELGFDRLMIDSSSIRVGMWMPQAAVSHTSQIQTAWNTRIGTFAPTAQFVELPILGLSAAGALSYSPFLVHAQGSLGATFVIAKATPDVLTLRQSH